MFFGAAVAGSPHLLIARARAQMTSELPIPDGPLANIPAVEKKTLTAGAIDGIDDEVFAPPGFDVRAVARQGLNPLTGQPDPEGFEWHIDPDGGAVFPSKADGGWVYVSNSEETPGGVGALRFDASGNLIDAYPILTGTRNNCAGGPTPWGTWLSCEETGNGEVWECDPFGSPETAVKKSALGAFPHEAAAIDPINNVCYMTEDGGSNRFWRFVSDDDDLSTTDDGITRMGLENGRLEVMQIEGFEDGGDPPAADLREPRAVTWTTVPYTPVPLAPQQFPTTTTSGTLINAAEGIWYYEIPEVLRQTPAAGTVPTRGVMFFATKRDNRVYAYDIDNQLVELIYDNENMQMETGFDDVDNVVVSPAGDVLVAEDGALMRLVVIVPNGQAKLLMQITKGGSEITGPAFTPDGSRLYFSSQRGPSGADGSGTGGATFEMTIPPEFRSLAAQQPPEPDPQDDDPQQPEDPPADPPDDEPVADAPPTVVINRTEGGSGAFGAASAAAAAGAAVARHLTDRGENDRGESAVDNDDRHD